MNADRYADVKGARIRYRTEGSGPPALLIHGIGASLEYWQWTVPALRDRYTTFVLDFPGFGLSDPLELTSTPEGAAEATLGFMDSVGIEAAVIVGSSLGGGIAVATAGSAPGRCAALVLAAPAGFGVGVGLTMRLATLPLVGEALLALTGRFPVLGLRDAFADRRRIPAVLYDLVRRDSARATTGQTFLRVLRTSASPGGIKAETVASIHSAAARIEAPTLLVWGDRDRVIPPDQAETAAGIIRDSRVKMLPGIGHVPFIESAGEFNAAMISFLGEIEGTERYARLAGAGPGMNSRALDRGRRESDTGSEGIE